MARTLSNRVSRVAITGDDDRADALARSLQAHGLTPMPCPVLVETPPADPRALADAARSLDRRDWVIASSVRAVRAITAARKGPWPAPLRTAAVGPATAQALRDAGVSHPVCVAAREGAEALWDALSAQAWAGLDVLVLTTPGGRTLLADRLRDGGARVEEVEAYRMEARPPEAIRHDFALAAPDAVVVASARAVRALVAAVGADGLRAVRVVALGATSADALAAADIACEAAPPSFDAVARLLAPAAVRAV